MPELRFINPASIYYSIFCSLFKHYKAFSQLRRIIFSAEENFFWTRELIIFQTMKLPPLQNSVYYINLMGKRLAAVYSVVAVALIFCGTMMKSDFVWELQDLLNQLMVLPNVLALVVLAGTVAEAAHRK